MAYDRGKAVAYARKWAKGRNPQYYNFDGLGGDCTNFVSQCLYAGCGVMNYTPDLGWYYRSLQDRAAAWTGVEFLHKFLLANRGPGPYAELLPLNKAQPGDVIQLTFDGQRYAHSLLVTQAGRLPAPENILISAHTFDADNRALGSYQYRELRLLHILGARG